MVKTRINNIILTGLEKKEIKKFDLYMKKCSLRKEDLLNLAINDFVNKYGNGQGYQEQFTEFNRVELYNYPIYVSQQTNDKFIQLCQKIDLPKYRMGREILLSFQK